MKMKSLHSVLLLFSPCVMCQSASFTKLMAVGGAGAEQKAELLDLSGASLSCPTVADYDAVAYHESVGVFIDGHALVCGGYANGDFTDNCFSYNPQVR